MTKHELLERLNTDLQQLLAQREGMRKGYLPHEVRIWWMLKGRIGALRKAINLIAQLPATDEARAAEQGQGEQVRENTA